MAARLSLNQNFLPQSFTILKQVTSSLMALSDVAKKIKEPTTFSVEIFTGKTRTSYLPFKQEQKRDYILAINQNKSNQLI